MAVEIKELNINNSTEDEIKDKLMIAMLESLYNNKMIDINVYKKVKAEIEKS